MSPDVSIAKKKAAEYAVQFVRSGMVVGLGQGSTAVFAVRKIAALLEAGLLENITGVPCAVSVEQEAQRLGIPLTTLDEHPTVDLTIDGADEVTERLELIKGGGGALLREKIVAQASRREIIVVDTRKLSPNLGAHWPVPIEVVPFGGRSHMNYIRSLGGRAILRREKRGNKFITDQGNFIFDCHFGPIADPYVLSSQLNERAGIIGHGLFLGLATDIIIADEDEVRHIRRERTDVSRDESV